MTVQPETRVIDLRDHFTNRTFTVLRNVQLARGVFIATIRDLTSLTRPQVLATYNLGNKAFGEIHRFLSANGLAFVDQAGRLLSPCFSCGHLTPHKRLGPIKDMNGFQHNDACEQCDCINDPSFDGAIGIRYSIDHPHEPKAVQVRGGVKDPCVKCSAPGAEHPHG